ncbi:hypothetical protein ANN_23082 [Periplaneta americana]|uniref:Uncharacterized protein n=1 Tax=Periplaneta americana TaxID=6978 RepID=A0ABQ8SM32_PERAM|nr:hypothetical protein ANN_23082 [Periplaneta americana]
MALLMLHRCRTGAINLRRVHLCVPRQVSMPKWQLLQFLRSYTAVTRFPEPRLLKTGCTTGSIRRPEFECSGPQLEGPEFECSGPQLEGPEFECSGPQLEGPEFEYSGLSLKLLDSYIQVLKVVYERFNMDYQANSTSQLVHKYSEALRNIRHHAVRSMLAEALKEVGFTVHQEVQGLATQGSVRRIDIIAIKNNSTYILDPTIRFETHADQPHEVDSEKKRI